MNPIMNYHYPEEIRTADLFLTALLLNNKVSLLDVQLENRIKNKIVFVFPLNEKAEGILTEFKHGLANVNVLEFKKNYQHVVDLMHETKRQLRL